MVGKTSITPHQAATMAKVVYELEDQTMKEASALKDNDFTGGGVAPRVANRALGFTGALGYRKSSGIGYCAKSENGSEAFIVTRGTASLADALTDLDAIPASTGYSNTAAQGFVKTFKTMEQQFTRFMNTGGITTLHCIGHSLGGALATLVANKYSQCSHLKVNLYTFGSPRVFYGLGDKLTNVNSYRVFNMSDPVPMLGPFPLMHYDGGIGVGSSMQVCNPFAHFMESYLGICHRDVAWSSLQAPVHTPHGFVEKSKDFLSAGGAWMFRAFQHLVTYAVSVLGLGLGTAGAAIYATYTAVDVIFELLQKGMSKLSTWIVGLLRGMSRFVKNGWESAKASSNDSYYKSKTVILYIVEQFLMKLKQLAMSALNQAKPMIGSGVTAVKALKSARLPLPTMFL